MKICNEKVILRDMVESDIDDRIYWELYETEWQKWDAPWEYDKNSEDYDEFNPDEYREISRESLKKEKNENSIRWSFQICINDKKETHIGWVNAYDIDGNYFYTSKGGMTTIGINIPCDIAREKGLGTSALLLFIEYLRKNGINEIYTQTWSGNKRMIHLAEKIGFVECNRNEGSRIVNGQLFDGLTFKFIF